MKRMQEEGTGKWVLHLFWIRPGAPAAAVAPDCLPPSLPLFTMAPPILRYSFQYLPNLNLPFRFIALASLVYSVRGLERSELGGSQGAFGTGLPER